jgi:hypothetical protein
MYTLRPRLLPLVLRGCCDQGQLYFVPPASTLLSQLRIDRLQRGCRLLGCSELLSVVVTRESTNWVRARSIAHFMKSSITDARRESTKDERKGGQYESGENGAALTRRTWGWCGMVFGSS